MGLHSSCTIVAEQSYLTRTRVFSAEVQSSGQPVVRSCEVMACPFSWVPDAELHDLKNEHFGAP